MHTEDVIKQRLLRMLVDDPTMILVLKNKYINDDLWKFCIEREPSLFKEMKDPDEEMCLFAINVDGYNLRYIRKKFTKIKITNKMAYMAISNCPKSILFVPDNILDDGLKEMAFNKDPSLMKEFKDIRKEFIKKKVQENPSNIKYINSPDDELVCEAIKAEPNICVYFSKLTPTMYDTLKTHHPQFLELYSNIFSN